MTRPYLYHRWREFKKFAASHGQSQAAVGEAPYSWALRMGIQDVPDQSRLPRHKLQRAELRRICAREDVLFAYVCVMAWGGQDKGRGGTKNVQKTWEARSNLAARLHVLRRGGLRRSDACRLFLKKGKIPGLGPSFFTKLIFFFSRRVPRGEKPYIVDNVVLVAMSVLTGLPFLGTPSVGGYRACCEQMDRMGKRLACSGRKVEERLFAWRPEVPAVMHQAYPSIPIKDFK